MKKGWIITLAFLGILFFFHQSVVLSKKSSKAVLLAIYDNVNHNCSSNEHDDGWSKLSYDWWNKQNNINRCINENANSVKWCCVCFEDNYPDICSQLFDALSGTPVPPTNTPIPTIPTDTPIPSPVDCRWSNWSSCSNAANCGTGTQTRYIAVPAANGGNDCYGPSSQSCTLPSCPVDCVWGPWSPCSKECGDGIMTRSIGIPAANGGKSCVGSSTSACINKLCSSLGTGGLLSNTGALGGTQITFASFDIAPTPQKKLPTPTPEPAHFNVVDYYLQAFKQPTPTTQPLPTAIPTPPPVVPINNQSPTAAPTAPPTLPIPTLRPESIIPNSLASQSHTTGKTSFTLNTAAVSEITVVPNTVSQPTVVNEKPFLPQEQKLLAQNAGVAGGGIMVTLQQKTGSQFVTRQDELTVKRGNQFFSISNQDLLSNAGTSATSQKSTNSTANSTQTTPSKLEINANNVVAQSSMALSVDPLSGILIVETPSGPQKVSIMPDEALGIILELKALNNGVPEPTILLVSENGKLIYRVSGSKVEKFLGLLPIAIQKQILVSADTGSIVKVELSFISSILSFFTF